MSIQEYFDIKRELQSLLLYYIEDDDPAEIEYDFEHLINFIQKQKINVNRQEMVKFLRLLLNISNNHHRESDFFDKIERILIYFENNIKQSLSNFRMYQFFISNKPLIRFLFERKMIIPEQKIINSIIQQKEENGILYCHFFLPELKKVVTNEKFEEITNEINKINPKILENYEEKRKIGQNDSIICSLIRQDLIENFISYVTKNNISFSSTITGSIYETNSLLLMKSQPTLIEYAAFFGSIQIFQFLRLNNVEIRPRIWFYVIHSKNAQLVHFLEDDGINLSHETYIECFKEAIKCHHNDIADYINSNFFEKKFDDWNFSEEIIASSFKYYNFAYFPKYFDINNGLYYLCQYNYFNIVNFILDEKMIEIEIIKKIEKNKFFNLVSL